MRRRISECRASGLPEAINWAHYNPNSFWRKRKSRFLRFLPAGPDVRPESGQTHESRNDKLRAVGCLEPGLIRTTFRAAGEGHAKREVSLVRYALVTLTIGLAA